MGKTSKTRLNLLDKTTITLNPNKDSKIRKIYFLSEINLRFTQIIHLQSYAFQTGYSQWNFFMFKTQLNQNYL